MLARWASTDIYGNQMNGEGVPTGQRGHKKSRIRDELKPQRTTPRHVEKPTQINLKRDAQCGTVTESYRSHV